MPALAAAIDQSSHCTLWFKGLGLGMRSESGEKGKEQEKLHPRCRHVCSGSGEETGLEVWQRPGSEWRFKKLTRSRYVNGCLSRQFVLGTANTSPPQLQPWLDVASNHVLAPCAA